MKQLLFHKLLLISFLSSSLTLSAKGFSSINELEVDKLVNQARKDFNVPGIAVAIVKGNKTLLAKGYGLRNIEKNKKVTADTIFQIASNSKSMTSASLALLVDEGKLDWNDRVIDYLPEFQLYDPYVTREFTITDLLTHRSGLPLGAGDLLLFPDSENTSLKDVFKALATIKPVSSFRSEYAYDNLMYLVAGEVVARVSGMSWINFVEKRLFKPLGMKQCRGAHTRVSQKANRATPYVYVNGKFNSYPYESHELTAAAGGVNCSLNDMVKWVKMQLAHGKLPNGNQLISLINHQAMWSPKTIIRNRFEQNPNKMNIHHYALGWTIYESMKHQMVAHTGALGGMLTSMLLVPEKEIGILVFTNQQNGYARNAIISQILQTLLKNKGKRSYQDYVELSHKKSTDAEEKMQSIWQSRDTKAKHSLPLKSYAQTYVDEWYGKVNIQLLNNNLYFSSERSPNLAGKIKHYQYNSFIVEWNNRSLFADAYLIFNLDEKGKITQLEMKEFDPRTDFSFDFHHLNLKPIEKEEKDK